MPDVRQIYSDTLSSRRRLKTSIEVPDGLQQFMVGN